MSDQLYSAYQRLGSVHRVGEELGISGDSVHRTLVKAGFDLSRPSEFTEDQKEQIRNYYSSTPPEDFDLGSLAANLGKSKPNVSRAARRMGLTVPHRRLNSEQKVNHAKRVEGRWKSSPHPRGMLGKNHTEEVRAALSEKHAKNWATAKTFGVSYMAPEVRSARSEQMARVAASRPASNNYSRTKAGYRIDLGDIYFRSSWEANYARYLNLLIKMKVIDSWEYEPETFWFEKIKRGVRSYRVDFKVNYRAAYSPVFVEVKGWMDPKSKTKIARFRRYYPQHTLEIVGDKEYRALAAKWKSAIPNWESPQRSSSRERVVRHD